MPTRQFPRKERLILWAVMASTAGIAAATAAGESLIVSNRVPEPSQKIMQGLPYASGGQEQKERLLHRLPAEKGEPISITSLTVKGKGISFDERFVADDDWLGGLSISFKNRSGKSILLVSFRLLFPRPAGSSQTPSLGNIFYGNSELLARRPPSKEQLVGIAPGQTESVQLRLDQFQDFQSLLKATGYPPSIEQIDLKINDVIFQDDTMWHAGEILHRDKQNPNSWWVEPRPSGKVKTPSFRSPNVRAAHHRPATLMTAFLDPRYGRNRPSRFFFIYY